MDNCVMKRIVCINDIETIPIQIKFGYVYYLDLLSLEGYRAGLHNDSSYSHWYGKVYEDENREKYVGLLDLEHFMSED